MNYKVYTQKNIIVVVTPETVADLTKISQFMGTVNAPLNVTNKILTLSASQLDELKTGALSFIEDGQNLFFNTGWYEIDGSGIKENDKKKEEILSGGIPTSFSNMEITFDDGTKTTKKVGN